METAVGSYTGNATDDRAITGVGFQPDLVLIHGSGSGSGAWRVDVHVGDLSADWSSSTGDAANKIQTLDSDGFTVGTDADVNTNSTVYYWMAFRDNGDGDFETGTYTGNNTDNRDITGLGLDPDFVAIKGDSNTNGVYNTKTIGADDSGIFFSSGSNAANRIQSLGTAQFQIGTSSFINANSTTYNWFAFKNVSSEFIEGTYIGNGSDDRSITGLGFQPEIVMTNEDGSSKGIFRTTEHSGDSSLIMQGSNATNRIQAFESDGFQLGTSTAANDNSIVYYYFAWKIPAAGGATIKTASDTTEARTTEETVTEKSEAISETIPNGILESTVALVSISASDTLSTGILENIALVNALSNSDSLATIISEEVSGILIQSSRSDILEVNLSELVVGEIQTQASDTIPVGITSLTIANIQTQASDDNTVGLIEAFDIVDLISGLVEKTASDTPTIGLTELAVDFLQGIASDTLPIPIDESTMMKVTIIAQDPLTIFIADAKDSVNITILATDGLTVGITEDTIQIVQVVASESIRQFFEELARTQTELSGSDNSVIIISDTGTVVNLSAVGANVIVATVETLTKHEVVSLAKNEADLITS